MVDEHRDVLLTWLSGERLTERKARLRNAVKDFSSIFTLISNAYLYKLGAESMVEECKASVAEACKGVERAVEALSNSGASGPDVPVQSYASVVGRKQANQNAPTSSISLGRGKSFPIRKSQRIVIGPREENAEKFPNSKATKDALQACVDPKQLKMRIQNVRFGPGCSVMLEGENLNVAELQNCQPFAEAGLEIKPESTSKPRIIIHDIPVHLERNDIINCIVDQNFQEASVEDFQVKYLYPAGSKKFRSCVIELRPEHRVELLKKNRVNIEWMACRVDDHVSIRQCFNCMGFGHIASSCKNKACCPFCAGEHLSKDCESRKNLKCVNCQAAKYASVKHSALDKVKCVILRKKIEQILPFVNYG